MRLQRCLILAFILGLLVIPANAVESDTSAELADQVVESLEDEAENTYYIFDSVVNGVEPLTAEDVNDTYGVGTSNISIFGPVASKLPYGTHYVYWRDSQYVYKLAYSDEMSFDGSEFVAETATVITYTTSTGYNSQATYVVGSDTDFSLDPADYLVWSDLGDYPT